MRLLASLDDQPDTGGQSLLRRKLDRAPAPLPQGGAGAERCWRVVLARAARDTLALGMDVVGLTQSRASLAELLDMPPDRALIAVLEGPGDGLGLMAVSAPLLAAMTEMQTIGRVSASAPALRKPTRTDAAMVAGFVDAALAGLDASLVNDADLMWAGSFRYASFLEDPRPLGLLLEDAAYRVFLADITVEGGTRAGQILMALPAEGRGERPKSVIHVVPEAMAGHAFTAELSARLDGAPCELQAVIHRITVPLSAVMAMNIGDILTLSLASIDRIGVQGLNGHPIAEGRLGQNRGMRAVRLTPTVHDSSPVARPHDDIFHAQKVAVAG